MLFRFALIVFFSWSLAQGFPDLQGVVATDSSLLDISAINEAAATLEEKNIKPLVLFIEAEVGLSLEEASAYFDSALESYGLLNNGMAPENLFALFVGTNPLPNSANQRPIYIAYGQGLVPVLKSLAGSKDVDDFIRNELMIPKLLEGNFTGAFTSALSSLAERLSSSTEVPVTDSQRFVFLKQYGWLALPLLALLGVLGLRRRSKTKHRTLALESRENLDDLQKELKKDLDELEGVLSADAAKQTEMILLSDFMKEEHPEEWQKLRDEYSQAVKKRDDVAQKMQVYDLEQRTAPRTNKLQAYEALKQQITEVKSFVQSLNDKWLILNREVLAIPDRITALKGSLQHLRIGYKERSEFLSADEVFKPLEEDILELEAFKSSQSILKVS